MLQSIICLGHGGSTEGVGLYDVCSSQQVVLQKGRDEERDYASETDCGLCVHVLCAKCWTSVVVPPGQVYLVNFVYDIWTREAQKVIVSHQRFWMLFEFIPPKVVFFKLMLLDHGSHAPIQNHHPLLEYLTEFPLQWTFT